MTDPVILRLVLTWVVQPPRLMRLGIDYYAVSESLQPAPCLSYSHFLLFPKIDHNIRITDDELHALNSTSIPLSSGGGSMGMMAVFHELHCLVRRQHFVFVTSSENY